MIKLNIINQATNKIESYATSQEGNDYLFMENMLGLGIVYNILKKFKSKDELDNYLLEIERDKQSRFKIIEE